MPSTELNARLELMTLRSTPELRSRVELDAELTEPSRCPDFFLRRDFHKWGCTKTYLYTTHYL